MAIPRSSSIPVPPAPPSFSGGAPLPPLPPQPPQAAPQPPQVAPKAAPTTYEPVTYEGDQTDREVEEYVQRSFEGLLPPQEEPEELVASERGGSVTKFSRTGDITKLAESHGFLGLDLNAFGVLPTVSLKEGQFQTGDGALMLGESFICHFYGGKPKYVYKTELAQADPRNEVLYSFDQLISSGGSSIKEKISKWEAAGIPWTRKDYVDVRIGIVRDQSNPEPLLALLSIPPTSVSSYTNMALQLMHWVQVTGGNPGERLVKVWKGPKVTKVKFPFHPIKLELLPE